MAKVGGFISMWLLSNVVVRNVYFALLGLSSFFFFFFGGKDEEEVRAAVGIPVSVRSG